MLERGHGHALSLLRQADNQTLGCAQHTCRITRTCAHENRSAAHGLRCESRRSPGGARPGVRSRSSRGGRTTETAHELVEQGGRDTRWTPEASLVGSGGHPAPAVSLAGRVGRDSNVSPEPAEEGQEGRHCPSEAWSSGSNGPPAGADVGDMSLWLTPEASLPPRRTAYAVLDHPSHRSARGSSSRGEARRSRTLTRCALFTLALDMV